MELKEIRKFAESLDKGEASYMLGYLRGFHGITIKD